MSSYAIVLLSTSGHMLLVTTNGIEVKQAIHGGNDAYAQLRRLSATSDPGDISSSIQGLPLSCGSIRLWNGRWRAFYRVLGPTVAMVLAPGNQNAFSSLDLLAQAVRVATADGKIPEVPVERIQRKFAEIYLALDALVGSCGALNATASMADARATLEALSNPSAYAAINAAKRASRPSSFPASYKVSKRTLSSQVDQLGLLAFDSSSALSHLRPLPGFELERKQQPRKEPQPVLSAQPMPSIQAEAAAKQALGDDPFEDIFGPITNVAIKPAEAKKVEPLPVPARPLLRLSEVWRAEAEGGRVLRCGLDGAVMWAEDASKDPACPASFTLGAAADADHRVKEALAGAQRHATATSIAADGSGAIVASAPSSRMSPPPVLLRYHVSPGPAMVAPVLVNIGMSMQPVKDNHVCALVGVRVVVNQLSHVEYQGMTVSVTFPPLLAQPTRVSPTGAIYDQTSRRIMWKVPAGGIILSGGVGHALAAVFMLPDAEAVTLAAAAQKLVAEVTLTGATGGTYTGTVLNQASKLGDSKFGEWKAQVTARPEGSTS